MAITVASRSIAAGSAGAYIIVVIVVIVGIVGIVGIRIGLGSRYIGNIGGANTVLIKAKVPSIQINGGIAEHLSVL